MTMRSGLVDIYGRPPYPEKRDFFTEYRRGRSTEYTNRVAARFEPGDVVRVRTEEMLSVVVVPAHRKCEIPANAPDLGAQCCVPIALVRTPAHEKDGILRWVEPRDLARADPDSAQSSPAAE